MKSFGKLIVMLLLVVIVAGGAAVYYLDSIAKKAIEYGGTEALGVATTLDKISISLLGGEASLAGLQIANPPGFAESTFMGLNRGQLAVSLGSLSGETVTIPRIQLSGLQVNLEQSGKKTNVTPILDRVRSGGGASRGGKPTAASTEPGKKFVVNQFLIENIKVTARLALLGQNSQVNLVIPKIELKNLGSDRGGMPLGELIQTVVQAVLDAAAKSSGSLSPALAGLLKGELKGLDGVKTEVLGKASAEVEKLAGQLEQQAQGLPPGTGDAVKQQSDKLLKDVKGLLGK